MANLLPIGRFSLVCRLSVKALRHYDELGLLRPAVVDPSSGYRYYGFSQVRRAEAIRILRSLDMPLSEIREVLDADDGDAVAAVLARHRARLEADLARRTAVLTFLRRLIDHTEDLMPYQVSIKELPARHVAVLRRRTTGATMARDIGQGYALVARAVAASGGTLAGPPFLVMDDVIDADSDGELEVGFPVAEAFAGSGEVVGEKLAAGPVAFTVHRGPYGEVGPAYHALQAWVTEHGHEVAGPPREVYLTDPQETPDPADYVTEVQFPIR